LPHDFRERPNICKAKIPLFGGSICDYNTTGRVQRLDKYIDNRARADVYISNVPAGQGYKGVLHFIQLIKASYFQRYDHGYDINMEKYGEKYPPLYNLTNIKFPVAL